MWLILAKFSLKLTIKEEVYAFTLFYHPYTYLNH